MPPRGRRSFRCVGETPANATFPYPSRSFVHRPFPRPTRGGPPSAKTPGPVRLLPRCVSRSSSSPRRFAGCERAAGGGEPAATVPANAGFTKAGSKNNKSGSPPGRTAAVGRDPLRRGSTKNGGTDNQEVRRMGVPTTGVDEDVGRRVWAAEAAGGGGVPREEHPAGGALRERGRALFCAKAYAAGSEIRSRKFSIRSGSSPRSSITISAPFFSSRGA